MILRGILDNSLNGQLCLRGFAPIKELARISKADYTYQRNPIEGRTDIQDFLETQSYLFFPEVILSYKIKHEFKKVTDTETPIQKILSSKNYKSNVDKTALKIKTVDYKNFIDVRGSAKVTILELSIDESSITDENKPLHRIDGNHRLIAASKSDSPKVSSMVAPFCILLGQEFYEKGQVKENLDTTNFDKATKVFFHNINTKTIPLTSEQNLKVIIDDSKIFPDNELEEIMGFYALKTRELIKKVNPEYFSGISHILSKEYRNYYNEIFKRLLENGENQDTIVEKVFESLKEIDLLYNGDDHLKANSCFGLLSAFLYYHVQDNKAKLELFKKWIVANHIYKIEEITAKTIIEIFDKVAAKEIKVFVAMPFFDNDSEVVEEFNNVYKNSIEDIATKYSIKISLYPIMQNKGATQDQIQDIINKIQCCDIFIGDISDNNANVLYETGWARALSKQVVLVREQTSEKPKSDYVNDTYHTYKKVALSQTLGKTVKENVVEILNKNFGLIIEADV